MKAYNYSFSVNPSNISYGEMEFDSFRAREVLIDGETKGEYHIAPLKVNAKVLFSHMKRRMPQFRMGMVDPSGVLNLDYPIYLIVEDEMSKSCMFEIFEKFDREIQSHG